MKNKIKMSYLAHRCSVAPMLDWTDRHCRYFHRILTKNALLYTEMVTTGAILYGKKDFLAYNEEEHPLALQLGGNDPLALAKCAMLAEERGYNEVNLNIGCPSNRVQNGSFGACLMAKPECVADSINAMKQQVTIPVTIKTRIGIDDFDSYDFLANFIQVLINNGVDTCIIHARKAWLSGLSPKENREIPPLDYQRVYQIKRDFPKLAVVINGGIKSIGEALIHLEQVDGVMIGRAAYQNPAILTQVDREIFNINQKNKSYINSIRQLYPYIEQQLHQGEKLNHIIRATFGLFNGMKGAKMWRRHLSEQAHKPNAGIEVIERALTWIINNNEDC